LQSNGVTIAKQHYYEDEGWARDTADHRPAFQKMIKLVEEGIIKWIVVDALDRFGTKSEYQLIHYLYKLQEAGCKLYDVKGKEWTAADIATTVTAVVEGNKSSDEPRKLSGRVLGGMAAKIEAGEWMGGAVRLGLDVGCFSRSEPERELWRVILEGRDKRLKVYFDGTSHRFDGSRNFPQHQKQIEMLRLVPSRDRGKVAAAISVFNRYSQEAITFSALAQYVNDLGYRTCFGNKFLWDSMAEMLADPIYLGYYEWNKVHRGKFNRFSQGRTQLELNLAKNSTPNDKADWIRSRRLFPALIDLGIWNKVQAKLNRRTVSSRGPSSPTVYLSGLLSCARCNGTMMVGTATRNDIKAGDNNYMCSTYFKATRDKDTASTFTCQRNGVWQSEIEPYITKYLEDVGHRLEVLTSAPGQPLGDVTSKLREQERDSWRGFQESIQRLCDYLHQYFPDEYRELIERDYERNEEDARLIEDAKHSGPTPPQGAFAAAFEGKIDFTKIARTAEEYAATDTAANSSDFVADLLQVYRANFDPAAMAEEIAQLETEEDMLIQQWRDLPTERSKAKAKLRLQELQGLIDSLKAQQQDGTAIVEAHYREMRTLRDSILKVHMSIKGPKGERESRHRAQLLREVISRIILRFKDTGSRGGGRGKKSSYLTHITFVPVVGQLMTYDVEGSPASIDGKRKLGKRKLFTLQEGLP
jgi:DNA invertase Pin-like site-specific DNA recombinase